MVISLNKIYVSKANKIILNDISLTLNAQRIGIIGHNGSGKSTLAKLLNGLETCTKGTITFDSKTLSVQAMRKKVGFVFQNPDNQIVFPIVQEDLSFSLKNTGLSKKQIEEKIDEYLSLFKLSHLKSRRCHELSGGEKQLIALISVLIMQPEYIVLDEPTTLLDLKNRTLMIKKLQQLPQSLIIVSHDLKLMKQMNHLILLHENKMYQQGSPEEVLKTYHKISAC